MNAITEALYDRGKVADVFALAITKTAVVYSAPERSFREIKTAQDWQELLAVCPDDVRQKVEKEEVAAQAHVHQSAQASLW